MAYGIQGKTRSEVAKMRKKAMHFAPEFTTASGVSSSPYHASGTTAILAARSLTAGSAVQQTPSAGVTRKQGDIETMEVKERLTANPPADTSLPAVGAKPLGPASEVIVSVPVDGIQTTNAVTTATATAPAIDSPEHINQTTASTATPTAGAPTTKAITANNPKATSSAPSATPSAPLAAAPSIPKSPEARGTTYTGPLSRYDKQLSRRMTYTPLDASTRFDLSKTAAPLPRAAIPRAAIPRAALPRASISLSTEKTRGMELSSPALVGGLEASCYARGCA
ncbi:hypothetical protein BDV97DRAFT_363907 [Delphinella strobiligena]|nr:hypothetical protein BDV97DRAFT_363907 [Delphinella strobiligena]